ncbi:flagellar hook basal-body protein [Candidatus Aerophobetes bacterium]|nr:flagellar hook basal-body protein [Candidatus Aerophobetes bacterium]
MIRGLFSSVSGMLSMLKAQEVITNNIANVSTVGFKRDVPLYRSFSNILQRELQGRESQSEVEGTFIDFTQGKIISTGRVLDLAIKGKGFFVLLTPQGIAYTRAGSFSLDNKGRIITPEGYYLLGSRGPVTFPSLNFSRLEINREGEVIVDGRFVDKIRVEVFQNPALLYKQGDNLFKPLTGLSSERGEGEYSIGQGYLELSNVDIIEDMVNLIANLRLYEAAQRAVRLQDATLEKVCNELVR